MDEWEDDDFVVEVAMQGWRAEEIFIEVADTGEKLAMDQWQPVLITESAEMGPGRYELAVRFDSKAECQEFIADFIIASGFHPEEEFD